MTFLKKLFMINVIQSYLPNVNDNIYRGNNNYYNQPNLQI